MCESCVSEDGTVEIEGRKMRYIDPLTDWGFKRLFGSEMNKEILLGFLQDLFPEKDIRDISYLGNENAGATSGDRKAVFDVSCRTEKGEEFIVEMQKAPQEYFRDRALYYSTFPLQRQAGQNTNLNAGNLLRLGELFPLFIQGQCGGVLCRRGGIFRGICLDRCLRFKSSLRRSRTGLGILQCRILALPGSLRLKQVLLSRLRSGHFLRARNRDLCHDGKHHAEAQQGGDGFSHLVTSFLYPPQKLPWLHGITPG